MINKANTEGMKLYSGGKEVTKEDVELAIKEYKEKLNSPEYQKDIQEYASFRGPVQSPKKDSNYKYYKLHFSPYTVFKINQENLLSYKLDHENKCWVEFPDFLVDFEHGNIMVDPVIINDEYPIISAVDQSKGVKL